MILVRRPRLNRETVHKVFYRAQQRLRARLHRARADPAETELSDEVFVYALNGKFQSTEAFLEHMQNRVEPCFFVDPASRERMATLVRTHFPASIDRAIDAADQVCAHVFDLLGSGPTFLGERIDWHKDFKVCWQWESVYYTDVNYLDLDQPYDVKVPWELSRFHHAVTLGRHS